MTIPQIFAQRYQIRKIIKQGHLTSIYHGHDPKLGRDIAIKVLPLQGTSTSERDRFYQAAQSEAALQHPHILPIYHIGMEEELLYIVMPFLKGGNLQQRLEQITFLPKLHEVANFAKMLANALHYAHSHQIIHRDVKTSNILFDEHGMPLIGDFSLAKMMSANASNQTQLSRGTAIFMAPELWRGDYISPAVDQYAFAIILFALLAGQYPSTAIHDSDWMNWHLNIQADDIRKFAPHVPESMALALLKAMNKDPRQRFPNILSFSDAFANLSLPIEQSGFFTNPLQATHEQTKAPTITKAHGEPAPISTQASQAMPVKKPRKSFMTSWLWYLFLSILALLALGLLGMFILLSLAPSTTMPTAIPSNAFASQAPEETEILFASTSTRAANLPNSFPSPLPATATRAVEPFAEATIELSPMPSDAPETLATIAATPSLLATPTDMPISQTHCPNSLISRLDNQTLARNLPSSPNLNLRAAASTTASIIGSVPSGHLLYLTGEVNCADGIAWWAVTYQNQSGWLAESLDNIYWLEPIRLNGQNNFSTQLSAYTITAAYQDFEYGHMFWLNTLSQIWVLNDSGYWSIYPDNWREGDAETDPNIQARSPYQQPERGFGLVWRSFPQVRDSLGWATTEEWGYPANFEYDPVQERFLITDFRGEIFRLQLNGQPDLNEKIYIYRDSNN